MSNFAVENSESAFAACNRIKTNLMGKNNAYTVPPICWLKITDYMRPWMEHELGGEVRAGEQRVICIQHLKGARDILKMETREEMLEQREVGNVMSATLRNCIEAGLKLDEGTVVRMYGIRKEDLKAFMPIECPKNCLTKNGVLRTWTNDVYFGRKQALELMRLLREEYWKAVGDYNNRYKKQKKGRWYPAVEMIEEFCAETNTPDLYIDVIRREWQRRSKRSKQ